MSGRAREFWLVGLAGFSEHGAKTLSNCIKRINKDRYMVYYLPLMPDLNGGKEYTTGYCDKFIRNIFLQAFLKCDQPSRFCNHLERPCSLDAPGSHDCKKEDREACGKSKPRFILVLYADEKGPTTLLEKVSKFAFPISLMRQNVLTQDTEKTVASVFAALENKFSFLKSRIAEHPRKINTPLVLPVRNFVPRQSSVVELLKSMRYADDFAAVHEAAHESWKIRDRGPQKGYRDRRSLDFKPADTAPHGRAAIPDNRLNDVLFALTTYYRLGIPIYERLHFDVDRRSGAPIDMAFSCGRLRRDTERITATHVNIFPNDVIGNAS